MLETQNNIPEQVKEALPENIQKAIIESFNKLFDNPEFVTKVQDKINELPEYTDRQSLTGVLNRLTWLKADTSRVTEQTQNRLGYLMASIDPKITQARNPNTTA